MGDLRSTFRFIAPELVSHGYRVAIIDLRGHGDSSTTFTSHDNPGNAADVTSLVPHLGGPAVLVGNSMGAAISVLVAAEHPELVAGMVLVGPFVRNGKVGAALKAVMRVMVAPPFLKLTWNSYLPALYMGVQPPDQKQHLANVRAGMKGREHAISRTMRTDHADAEAALPRVHTPVLVVMGDLDPDFASPRDEADWIVERLGGTVLMVPDAGHYPQAQRPDIVLPAIRVFLATVAPNA